MDLGYDPADTCTEVRMSRVTGAAPMGCSLPTATHLYIYSLVALYIYLYVKPRYSSKLQDSQDAAALSNCARRHIFLHLYISRRASKNLPLLSPASYFIINPAAGWSPFSISHSSATQQGVVASSDQLQAIEAVQPTPPCRGAIQGLRHQSLVCREGKRP